MDENDEIISISQLGPGLASDSIGSQATNNKNALLSCMAAAKKRRAELVKYIYSA